MSKPSTTDPSASGPQRLKTPLRSSLDHNPGEHWRFDESVTAVFDDMLARSIPQIETMRRIVYDTASRFIQPHTCVVDLGCSLGGSIGPLIESFGSQNRFIGIEASVPMADECRRIFATLIDDGVVEIRNDDLRGGYPSPMASVTLSILTLMFTPIEHRFRILSAVHEHTLNGGAFLLVEKILGTDAKMNALLEDLYCQHKKASGYTDEAISRKSLSLEGVLVPMTASWNEQMLRDAGFRHVECFWRCLNFGGWVAVKR